MDTVSNIASPLAPGKSLYAPEDVPVLPLPKLLPLEDYDKTPPSPLREFVSCLRCPPLLIPLILLATTRPATIPAVIPSHIVESAILGENYDYVGLPWNALSLFIVLTLFM